MTLYDEIKEPEARLYAVGDLHGCLDELTVLVTHLKEREGLTGQDRVIFIGDYIDRGPASKAVIDLLLEFAAEFPSVVFLKGNHEDMLLGFVNPEEGNEGEVYLVNGGEQTLKSYGVAAKGSTSELRQTVLESVPLPHWNFFRSLKSYVISPAYVFAHAGLNPLRDLRLQTNLETLWIRDEFLMNMHYFNRVVVFGHTPFQDVFFNLPYKIGIDTGLVYGNKLTCVELTQRKIFQVGKGKKKVLESGFPGGTGR